MATVQQSIDIKAPVHAAYNQLSHFEDYPQFMEEVQSVQQLDDRHFHWTTIMSNRSVEWDAEITEQEPGRCIAWHNTSGPTNAARIEVQALGADTSRVTFTLESEAQQVPGASSGFSEQEMAQRLKMDLARLKDFIEGRQTAAHVQSPHMSSEPRGTAQQQDSIEAAQGERGSPRNSPAPTSSYAAGSEGWSGEEDPLAPVKSASEAAAGLQGATAARAPAESVDMRHLGQMPQDTAAEPHGGTPASDARGNASAQTGVGANAVSGGQKQAQRPAQPGPGSAAPGQGAAGMSAVAGAAGGTDASAGAQLSGSHGAGGDNSLRKESDAAGVTGAPGGAVRGDAVTPGAGANAAGGTGLGASASADDTRTGTGTASGSGTALTGSGTSAARDAGNGSGSKP